MMLGAADGAAVGSVLGLWLGWEEGMLLGNADGAAVGSMLGL
jgi:outer membrane lipoprotein SlyB